MKRIGRHNLYGAIFVVLGLIVVGVELGRYWIEDHPIHPMPVGIALVLCVIGGWFIDNTKTKDLFQTVTTGAVTILGALPFGRRWSDKLVTPPTGTPIPPPVVPVPPSHDPSRF